MADVWDTAIDVSDVAALTARIKRRIDMVKSMLDGGTIISL
jgi:hypothetical protein